jgi:uncharacterized protein YbaR (Trm112 family)
MQNNSDTTAPVSLDMPLELLVCPKCKGALEERVSKKQIYLHCHACKLAYPVNNGIPLMVHDEVVEL